MQLERKTVHISDDTGRIAMYEYRTVGWDNSPQELMRYIYSNNLSSAMLELDDNGNIISYEEYHPFGTTAYQATNSAINAVAKRYRYTGKERDEESGLYYHGARYYIPWLCRWTQCDPIGIKDGLNVYEYCSNNPISLHDPTGKWGETFKQMYSEAKQAAVNTVKEVQRKVTAVKETITNKVAEVKQAAVKKIENAKAAVNHKLAEVKETVKQKVSEAKTAVKEAGNKIAAHKKEIIEGVIVGAVIAVAVVAVVATGGAALAVIAPGLAAAAATSTTLAAVGTGLAVAGAGLTVANTVQSLRGRDLMNNQISDSEAMRNLGTGIGGALGGGLAKPISKLVTPAGTAIGNSIKNAVQGEVAIAENSSSLGFSVNMNATGWGTAPMKVEKIIEKGANLQDIIDEGKYLTFATGNEHAIVKLANGERALVSGGPGGIFFKEGEVSKIFGHSHPKITGPSDGDYDALEALKQAKQYIFEGGEKYAIYNKAMGIQ